MMRSKLTTARVLVVVAGLVFAMTWALPAIGASPLKLAKKALTAAKGAQKSADKAQSTADQALTTANGIVPGPRAYGRMDNPCATSSACSIDHAKGISGIRQTSTGGLYCVAAPGIAPSTTASVVSVDVGDTSGGVTEPQAMPNSNGAACTSGEFEVQTRDQAGSNVSTVAFFILIP